MVQISKKNIYYMFYSTFKVSMQHNEGITANTEFEYLKNIMFQVNFLT